MRIALLLLAIGGLVTTGLGIAPSASVHGCGNYWPSVSDPAPPASIAADPSDPSDPAAPAPSPSTAPADRDARPLVQFAICLDTSGSMEGLLDSARQKLWAITNELALAEPAPRLEVALLTFGNDGHNPARGWVARHLDFTEDLDSVSELLFSFVTNGGTELVGRVLQSASTELAWSDDPGTLRLVFVAGNESADQDGEVPYREAAAALVARDITVSAIYCGDAENAIAPGWREISLRGDGHFATIDQDHGTLTIATPFDAELTALGTRLNDTYIPYGDAGQRGLWNQTQQDDNAQLLNQDAAASRATCKASSNYFCSWDLCDLVREKRIEIEKIVIADLPEALRTLTIAEVIEHVNAQQAKRDGIQAEIQALSAKRQAFLDGEMAKRALTEENAFDAAVRAALRERAERKGFRFPAAVGIPAQVPASGPQQEQETQKATPIVVIKEDDC